MSLYACPRHGGYHEHAHFCPACIEYVAQFLKELSLDRGVSLGAVRANANRCLVRLGRRTTPHVFRFSEAKDICEICSLPKSNEVHR